jgi:hypothetical protein
MYRKMGSEFLGTYVQYDIDPAGPNAKYTLPFNRDQIIRRIRCFMTQRDKCEKTYVSFYDEGSTDIFQVKACNSLTMKKTFAPLDAMIRETKPVQVKAGFKFGGTGEPHTLWVVKGCSSESVDLRNEYALSLYHHTC